METLLQKEKRFLRQARRQDFLKTLKCGATSHQCGESCVPKTKKCKLSEEQLQSVVEKYEDQIKDAPIEHAISFDENGRIVYSKLGEQTRVEFSPEESRLIKGSILTHNHPNIGNWKPPDPRADGFSFSEGDIKTACNLELKEIRAVSSGYRHSLKPPKEGWNRWTWAQTAHVYEKHRDGVLNELYDRVLNKTISPNRAEVDYWHLVNKRFAAETGMRYTRTHIKSGKQDSLKSDSFKCRIGKACGDRCIPKNYKCRSTSLNKPKQKDWSRLIEAKPWEYLNPEGIKKGWMAVKPEEREALAKTTIGVTAGALALGTIAYISQNKNTGISSAPSTNSQPPNSPYPPQQPRSPKQPPDPPKEPQNQQKQQEEEQSAYAHKVEHGNDGEVDPDSNEDEEGLSSHEKEVLHKVKQYEDTIKDAPLENGALFDEDGNILFTKLGEKDKVGFTRKQLEAMRGRIFTHNHPRGTTFKYPDPRAKGFTLAFNDIAVAYKYGLKEVRAVSPGYRHSMILPKEKDMSKWEDYEKQHDEIRKKMYQRMAVDIMLLKISRRKAEVEFQHEVMKEFAKVIGGKYTRVPIKNTKRSDSFKVNTIYNFDSRRSDSFKCKIGKACGDRCIPKSYKCHSSEGHSGVSRDRVLSLQVSEQVKNYFRKAKEEADKRLTPEQQHFASLTLGSLGITVAAAALFFIVNGSGSSSAGSAGGGATGKASPQPQTPPNEPQTPPNESRTPPNEPRTPPNEPQTPPNKSEIPDYKSEYKNSGDNYQDENPEVIRIIKDEEEKIKNKPIEHAVAVNDQGEVVVRTSGIENQVTFTQDELEKMGGVTLTHNHPVVSFNYPDERHKGVGLSPQDIAFAFTVGLKEIRAVTPHYRYCFVLPKGRQNANTWAEVQPIFQEVSNDVYFDLSTKFIKGEIDEGTANMMYCHLLPMRFAKRVGAKYKRENMSQNSTNSDSYNFINPAIRQDRFDSLLSILFV